MLRSSRAGRKEAARFHTSSGAGPSQRDYSSSIHQSTMPRRRSTSVGQLGAVNVMKDEQGASSQIPSASHEHRPSALTSRSSGTRASPDERDKARQPSRRVHSSDKNGMTGDVLATNRGTVPDDPPSDFHEIVAESIIGESPAEADGVEWNLDQRLPQFSYGRSPTSSEHTRRTEQTSPPTTHSPSHEHSIASNQGDADDEPVQSFRKRRALGTQSEQEMNGGALDTNAFSSHDESALYHGIGDTSNVEYSVDVTGSENESRDFTLEPERSTLDTRDSESSMTRASSLDVSAPNDTDGDETTTPPRARYRRQQPREIPGGDSLIANRTRRTGRKSLRQIEAEESGSSSPRRRRPKTHNATMLPSFASAPSDLAALSTQTQKMHTGKGQTALSKTREVSIAEGQQTTPVLAPASGRGRSSRKVSEPTARALAPTAMSSRHSTAQSTPTESPVHVWSSGDGRKVRRPRHSGLLDATIDESSMRTSRDRSRLDSVDTLEYSADSLPQRSKPTPRDIDTGTRRLTSRAAKTPDWKRKTFLTSGLYSDDFKTDGLASIAKQEGRQIANAPLRKKAPLLPLPTDFGYWMLVEKRDFRLPFPIIQEIDDIRAKLATKRKPPPYKHISTNRYVSRPKLPGEIMVCQCPPTGNCGDSCVNRQTQYLCHPKHCPCGDNCTNVQFGKRKPVKTEVKWYGSRGFGLRTTEAILKDGFVDEYRGEVISYNQMVWRVRDHYKAQGNYYFLMYDAPAGEMLDGGLRGNITRFANHSCDPNCKIQKWLVCGTDEARAGEFQVALFAARDIAAGEELTYDYGWSAFSPKSVAEDGSTTAAEICHCGATNCSGFMGVKKPAVLPKPLDRAIGGSGRRARKRKGAFPRKDAAEQSAAAAAIAAAGREARATPSTNSNRLASSIPDAYRPEKPSENVDGAPLDQRNASTPLRKRSKQQKQQRGAEPEEDTNQEVSVDASPQSVAAKSTPGTSPKKRIAVKDRVAYVWTAETPPNLIDSKNVPILIGKRQRRPNDLGVERHDSTSRSMSRSSSRGNAKRRRMTTGHIDHGNDSIAQERTIQASADSLTGVDTTTSDMYMAADGNVPFDVSKHPPGTKFYTRAGKLFDFTRLLEKRRGQKPRVYTAEELLYAQNRHRASVAKANRHRRAKLKANRTL